MMTDGRTELHIIFIIKAVAGFFDRSKISAIIKGKI